MQKKIQRLTLLTVILAVVLLSAACQPDEHGSSGPDAADMQAMPQEIQDAPASVRQAYLFNVAHPDLMKQIPCYCGCGTMGHTSNYACYVQDVDANSAVTYDTHALGCSICVDITQDAKRLFEQGKDAAQIKAYIDQTYSQYGPSNIP